MSDEQLKVLEAELGKRLGTSRIKMYRILWVQDVDDEGWIAQIPMLDDMGEDVMVAVTWPATNGQPAARTFQVITLALLDDVGPEKLAEMLAPLICNTLTLHFSHQAKNNNYSYLPLTISDILG